MTIDFEMKVKTEHFIKASEERFVENEQKEFGVKLETTYTGLRRSPDKDVIDLKGKHQEQAKLERKMSKRHTMDYVEVPETTT
jgi:hypothetical protein